MLGMVRNSADSRGTMTGNASASASPSSILAGISNANRLNCDAIRESSPRYLAGRNRLDGAGGCCHHVGRHEGHADDGTGRATAMAGRLIVAARRLHGTCVLPGCIEGGSRSFLVV